MMYNQSHGNHGHSWPLQGQGNHGRAAYSPEVGESGGAEQSFGTGQSSSKPNAQYPQWSNEAVAHVAGQHAAGYSHHDEYRDMITPENGNHGRSDAPPNSDTVGGYQSASESTQGYLNVYQNGAAYQSVSYPTEQAFPGHLTMYFSPSISPAIPGYPPSVYPYDPQMASTSASPPGPTHIALQYPLPENSPICLEYSISCPYDCGTILTGIHALGNLTRHIKTRACTGSNRAKVSYPCPIDGCGRAYARSDGLRVHMRRRHGAPAALPKSERTFEDDEEGDEVS
ncbi:hypothetical protein EJ02DRAFT_97754 [Clathrospora elynae]|uniref:C2H2-type domain-containing protein n=1 Tax=Clathrospora elynae TaxID=706981 RepID=A0A6A5SFM4_9PLEO|nr:hypothetical protein EJ02DRAFT_97754 [Clathrospora elynae]